MIDRTIHRTAWQITAVILIVVAGNRLIAMVLNGYVFSKLLFDDPTARTVYVSSATCSLALILALSALCYYVSLRPRQSETDAEPTSGGHYRLWFVLGLRLIAIYLIATALPAVVGQVALIMITSMPEARDAYLGGLVEPITAIAIGGGLAVIASKCRRTHAEPDNTE